MSSGKHVTFFALSAFFLFRQTYGASVLLSYLCAFAALREIFPSLWPLGSFLMVTLFCLSLLQDRIA